MQSTTQHSYPFCWRCACICISAVRQDTKHILSTFNCIDQVHPSSIGPFLSGLSAYNLSSINSSITTQKRDGQYSHPSKADQLDALMPHHSIGSPKVSETGGSVTGLPMPATGISRGTDTGERRFRSGSPTTWRRYDFPWGMSFRDEPLNLYGMPW